MTHAPSDPALAARLFATLDRLGIPHRTVRHAPVFTVAESQELRGSIAGAHSKNLFVKDKKGRLFLVTALEDARLDLKRLHEAIGAQGRVSFGSPDRLMRHLGVIPGAVTPFGLVNDAEGRVTFVLDDGLLDHALLNFHPLTNAATTAIGRDDFLRFLEAIGHAPHVMTLPAPPL